METEKKIIGRCPSCGGNVVKTCKGYRCENNIGASRVQNRTCSSSAEAQPDVAKGNLGE